MKLPVFAIACLFLFLPVISSAQSINAGFVQGIWYADNPVIDGQPTRIYVAFRNNTDHDLSGTVVFSDNGKRIGTSEFHALAGRLVEAWVDWTPDFGTHSVSANISKATLHVIGGDDEELEVANIVAENIQFVDKDTDKDGIGDATDEDDDGDSISDADELAQGSDPLDPKSVPQKPVEKAENEETETPPATTTPRDGLEKYIEQETAHNVLTGMTETIEGAKESLDTYRAERKIPGEQKVTEETSSEISSTDTEITRTQGAPQKGIVTKIIDGFALLFFHLWSFVLFITSFLLSFPALIQVVSLVLFLIILLRIMRRMARRQQ